MRVDARLKFGDAPTQGGWQLLNREGDVTREELAGLERAAGLRPGTELVRRALRVRPLGDRSHARLDYAPLEGIRGGSITTDIVFVRRGDPRELLGGAEARERVLAFLHRRETREIQRLIAASLSATGGKRLRITWPGDAVDGVEAVFALLPRLHRIGLDIGTAADLGTDSGPRIVVREGSDAGAIEVETDGASSTGADAAAVVLARVLKQGGAEYGRAMDRADTLQTELQCAELAVVVAVGRALEGHLPFVLEAEDIQGFAAVMGRRGAFDSELTASMVRLGLRPTSEAAFLANLNAIAGLLVHKNIDVDALIAAIESALKEECRGRAIGEAVCALLRSTRSAPEGTRGRIARLASGLDGVIATSEHDNAEVMEEVLRQASRSGVQLPLTAVALECVAWQSERRPSRRLRRLIIDQVDDFATQRSRVLSALLAAQSSAAVQLMLNSPDGSELMKKVEQWCREVEAQLAAGRTARELQPLLSSYRARNAGDEDFACFAKLGNALAANSAEGGARVFESVIAERLRQRDLLAVMGLISGFSRGTSSETNYMRHLRKALEQTEKAFEQASVKPGWRRFVRPVVVAALAFVLIAGILAAVSYQVRSTSTSEEDAVRGADSIEQTSETVR